MAEEIKVSQNVDFPKCLQVYTQGQPILNEWTNHSAFYAIYPSYYFPFANQWLRKWLAWFDGYVPGIHDGIGGILSTRLGTTLCYRLAEQVFGGGLLYSNTKVKTKKDREALTFISGKWSEDSDLENQILKAFILAAAGGTSYIKTNIDKDEELWIDSWRADQCWTDVDFKGKISHAKFLIAKYTKTIPNQRDKDQNFFIVEERFIATSKDNKEYQEQYKTKMKGLGITPALTVGSPYLKYSVYRLQGVINSFEQGIDIGRALGWEEIPDDVKASIKESYGVLELNIPKKLPFLDLGVDMFKWTSFISNLPQLPYGESVIAKIQTYLFEYDFMNSCMNTDFYLGRGRILLPKALQSPKPKSLNGVNTAQNFNQGFDSFLYTKVDYASTEGQKPEKVQFEIRSQEWINSRNHLLECMATAIGISPSTIASYLNDASARTAREISSEESATALYIENRRKLFTNPINELIKRILLYKGYTDCVSVKFSKSGQTNITLLTENTVSAYNSGLISQYQAIKNLNPDMSEEELQEEIKRINEDQDRKNEQNNIFNGGFNDNIGGFDNGTEVDNEPDTEETEDSEEPSTELASDTNRGSTDQNQNSDKKGSSFRERLSNIFGHKKKDNSNNQ